jgi:hypothetical protein
MSPSIPYCGNLLLTCRERETWRDAWIVRIEVRDEPGVVNRIAHFLGARNINIDRATAVTYGDAHIVELAVDCRGYKSFMDGSMGERVLYTKAQLEQLELELAVDLIDCVDFFAGAPNSEIRRNRASWKLHHKVAFNMGKMERGVPLRARDGKVRLPKAAIAAIRSEVALSLSLEPADLQNEIVMLREDSGSDVVDALVTFGGLGIASAAIEIPNVPGSFADVTHAVKNAGFDLLVEHLAESRDSRKNMVWVLARDLSVAQLPADPDQVRERLAAVCRDASGGRWRRIA